MLDREFDAEDIIGGGIKLTVNDITIAVFSDCLIGVALFGHIVGEIAKQGGSVFHVNKAEYLR